VTRLRLRIAVVVSVLAAVFAQASAFAQAGVLGPSDPFVSAPGAGEPFLLNQAGGNGVGLPGGGSGAVGGTDGLNPMRMIGDAAALLPGLTGGSVDGSASGSWPAGLAHGPPLPGGGGSGGAGSGAPGPRSAGSGSVSVEEREGFSVALNVMILLTALSLVPSIMLMTTCFVRLLVVLALLRQAIGTQSVPPAQVITGLALILTMMVMAPTVDRVWTEAIEPWQAGEIAGYDELWDRASQPLRDYMFDQIEATGNWSSVYMLLNYQGVDTSDPGSLTRGDVGTATLVPAYMLSELKVAFLLGFRVFLPFLVIDMVIASILISMSMMMLPPILISVPFKLLLFVLADGWQLVVGSLLESFVQDGFSSRLSTDPAAAALPVLLVLAWPAGRSARRGRGRRDCGGRGSLPDGRGSLGILTQAGRLCHGSAGPLPDGRGSLDRGSLLGVNRRA